MTRTPRILTIALLIGACAAQAERADTFQKTVIRARDSSGSLVSKSATLTGNVEVRRGTLLIQAEHGVVTENAAGYQHVVMTTQPGEPPVRFRQRRDGGANLWMEGEALRVVYDDQSGIVDLSSEAEVRRSADGEITDEVTGEHIVYNSREETYRVSQLAGADSGDRDRRGTIVLQPPRKPSPAAPSTATERGQTTILE
ncbi:lipopolysaccharide transport periplasmic protein LptA [Duganella callida]|uniref:Lipopolysaccharide transport periplasmic protein LptA n=1 Tax=Duganella callida TaxID=2561932 RepID=A0A4Y9S1P4_9BURK|nr:lipopolysaccharide transport periplasmic protein LptA [Duganella callida]TFW13458.1 lipopolysaccharide transport periplasmic protein LptA [Duganella callida]